MVETAPSLWVTSSGCVQTADQCKFWVVFSAMARHPNGNPVVSVVQPVVVPVTAAAAVSSAD